MTIETKYNIGQEVWHCNNKLHKVIIEQISIVVKEGRKFCIKPFIKTQILYWIGYTWTTEDKLYPTKEELLKSI